MVWNSLDPRKLWVRYVVAIALIFTFVSLSYGAKRYALTQSGEIAEAIDLSGRQRMLSQRIAFYSTQLGQAGVVEAHEIDQLRNAIDQFEEAHLRLVGSDDSAPLVGLSDRLERMYFGTGPTENLHDDSLRFVMYARQLLTSEGRSPVALDHLTGSASGSLLTKLDGAVQEFEELSRREIQSVETVATAGYILAILVLIFVCIFIFVPAQRLVVKAISRLEESEQKFKSILASAPDPLVLVDSTGTIMMVNDRLNDVLGFEASELQGQPIETLLPLDLRERHVSHRNAFFTNPEVRAMGAELNLSARKSSGEILPVEVSLSPISIQGASWVAASIRDITERKKAESNLRDAYEVITGGISYAARIQSSILSDIKKLEPVLKDSFVLWEPRDRVGGDVYWCDYWGDGVLIVLADCTGHGVPGAFLTMLSTGALDHARMKVIGGDLQGLVSEFHRLLQQSLGQDKPESDADDGLELGACYITPDMEHLYFVGACFDLFVVEDGKIDVLRGTRKGIGYAGVPADQFFDTHHIRLKADQSFYVSTDGLIDQIGGLRNRSFGKKRLKELLCSIQEMSMTDQGDAVRRALVEYQGDQPRRDDVAAIGFKVL